MIQEILVPFLCHDATLRAHGSCFKCERLRLGGGRGTSWTSVAPQEGMKEGMKHSVTPKVGTRSYDPREIAWKIWVNVCY